MDKDQIKVMTELAAKAAGYDVAYEAWYLTFFRRDINGRPIWNPLDDDGDSRRLQLKLGLSLEPHSDAMLVYHKQSARWWKELIAEHSSPAEAARVAVLRAASELGGLESKS